MRLDTISPRPEWLTASNVMRESPGSFHAGAMAFLNGRAVPDTDTIAARISAFFRERRSALLVRLRGSDLGADASGWRNWIAGLR
jgi:hypothetical protein